eukprot:1195774-Prorocentrum_minimum.AAC.2
MRVAEGAAGGYYYGQMRVAEGAAGGPARGEQRGLLSSTRYRNTGTRDQRRREPTYTFVLRTLHSFSVPIVLDN